MRNLVRKPGWSYSYGQVRLKSGLNIFKTGHFTLY